MSTYDPEGGEATALCSGRIGLVSWAIFERGSGHVIAFRQFGNLLEIEIDTPAEQEAAKLLALGIIGITPGALREAGQRRRG